MKGTRDRHSFFDFLDEVDEGIEMPWCWVGTVIVSDADIAKRDEGYGLIEG